MDAWCLTSVTFFPEPDGVVIWTETPGPGTPLMSWTVSFVAPGALSGPSRESHWGSITESTIPAMAPPQAKPHLDKAAQLCIRMRIRVVP